MTLCIAGVSHRYGARDILHNIDLTIGAGEIVCLLGPSGDGKTTLLRLISGLEPLQTGRIEVAGRTVAGGNTDLPPEARGVGFVFQDYALFPHMNVADNVAFGLRHVPAAERRQRVTEALARVAMERFADAWPHTLSGGQQQRVALARALAPRPAVLLLDEAFASLDTRLRSQVRDDTLHVLQETGVACLMVTHDAEEAMFMSDRIVLLQGGQVAQLGAPEDLYMRPASRFVAEFLGEVNHLPVTVANGGADTPFGRLAAQVPDGPAEALIRPEGLRLAENGTPAEVQTCRTIGSNTLVHLRLAEGGAHLHARLPAGIFLQRGAVVRIALDTERAYVFSAAAGLQTGF